MSLLPGWVMAFRVTLLKRLAVVAVIAALILATLTALVLPRFRADLALATHRAGDGSALLDTRCGPIEVQQAGRGVPLLVVHGSGGGHDQGMAWARPLTAHGIRVVAMSRFGYLRTPRPADASPEAQADAHACLLDALGLERAAVMGVSAGAPSALQLALRHPQRVSALVLVVPILHVPATVPASAPPVSDATDAWLLRLLGSDFLYWSALKLARGPLFRHVLATPPELVAAASPAERARVHALAERVLPLSLRAAGLVDDTRLGKRLGPAPLESVTAPTLLISARDDGFGTYAGAAHAASRIPGARFVGYERGGHLLVGHDAEARAEILAWVVPASVPAFRAEARPEPSR